jgi:hypothetical protein
LERFFISGIPKALKNAQKCSKMLKNAQKAANIAQ